MSASPRPLFSGPRVRRRVAALARQINRDYRGKPLTVVAVLKGGFIFMADLVRKLTVPMRVDFVTASSYGRLVRSSGRVRLIRDADASLSGRHVLILEDVVDTGRTLEFLRGRIARFRPRSVRVCALLDKPSARTRDVEVHYVGFTIPDRFVVGYGLDKSERYRNLPYIAVLTGKRR